MADFSSNLKRIRKRENLSQDLLAEKLRVTRQTISNWERGNSYPDLDMLVQISEILNTNPNELLYPPVKNEKSYMDRLIKKTIWGKLAIVVFVVGFLFGLSSGSQAGNVKKCAVGKYPKSEKLGSAGQAACCACAHSRYLTGGSPSGLRV